MEKTIVRDEEISISFLLGILRKFWIILLAVTVVMGGIGVGYSFIFGSDRYVATASFWVNGKGNLNQSETMGAAQMATNYSELATKDILLRAAVKRGELATKWNCSEESAVAMLRSMVGVGKSNVDSLIFSISVSSGDADMTLDAITAIQYSMIEVVAKVNGDDTGTVDYIDLVGEVLSLSDVRHVGISYKRNVLIFAAAGFVLSYAALTAVVMIKNKKDEESAQKAAEYGTDVDPTQDTP